MASTRRVRQSLEARSAAPAAFASMQRHHRTRRCGRRLPVIDGPDAGLRLGMVGDPREALPQFDDGRQLAFLVEGGTDRGGINFGHHEHGWSMGHALGEPQARS